MNTVRAHILVAEDDPKQGELVRRYLEHEGWAVTLVGDGRAAVEEVRRREPDVVVLDIMMPNVDGLDACRILRFESEVPIVFVTARSTEDDLLLGLDLGADDYITKPYSPRELVARIRTLLRRTRVQAGQAAEVLGWGGLEIDTRRHEIRVDGRRAAVTPKEFAIAVALASEPGKAFGRLELLDAAFGFDHDVLERTVDVHLGNLRKKVEADPTQPRWFLTVYGVGYAFAEDG